MGRKPENVNQATVESWGDDADRFIMVFDDVWELLKGTSALSVYMALKRRVQGDGGAWYSTREVLSKEAGVSPKTFDRGMDVLEDLNLAQSTERFVPKDWDRRDESQISTVRDENHPVQIGNLYRIRFRTLGKNDQTPSSKRPDPLGKFDQTPSSNLHNRHISQDKDTKTNNPPIVPQGDVKDPALVFDEWYEHYPKKVGRGQAVKAFKTAIKKTDLETMIAATLVYAKSVEGKEKQFIKNPSTWLNGECWLDDVDVPDSFDDVGGDDELRL